MKAKDQIIKDLNERFEIIANDNEYYARKMKENEKTLLAIKEFIAELEAQDV